MLTKALTWMVVILIVIWVVSNPAQAGDDVHNWAASVVAFFTHLARG